MTRALPRANLDSDSLVHFLTENAMIAPARQTEDVGQQLGNWLNFRQAIALHGLLSPEPSTEPLPAHVQRTALIKPEALARHIEKVRGQLAESITQGAPAGSGLARIDMPEGDLDAPFELHIELKTAFEPYRRFLTAHQRQMESTLRNLRALIRLQLSKRGRNGQQLAALDAAFENILAEREAVLLAQTTKLLEKRFLQALKLHLQTPCQNDLSSWLVPMRHDLRRALLAELDTRLQPTLGLLEALTCETPSVP